MSLFMRNDELQSDVKENPEEKSHKKMVLTSLSQAVEKISPAWDVRDYVAVNPLFGFRHQHFSEVAQYIQSISGVNFLPQKKFFLKKYENGEITELDIQKAIEIYKSEVLTDAKKIDIKLDELLSFLSDNSKPRDGQRRICSLSDIYDQQNTTNKTEAVVNEVSKWASAYFDDVQATWKVPTQNMRFYKWWKSLCKHDTSMDGVCPDFRKRVEALPATPEEALLSLSQLYIKHFGSSSEQGLANYFYRLLFSVLGWSSFIKKFEFESQRSGDHTVLQKIGGLVDLLVVRMTYDMVFLEKIDSTRTLEASTQELEKENAYLSIWLFAAESSYRRALAERIANYKKQHNQEPSLKAQMVFCIDVRSEVMRRHLEKTSAAIQTIGFAGFFGLPVSLKGLGHNESDPCCPVLLQPQLEVVQASENAQSVLEQKKSFADYNYFRKSIQQSASSCFSFVETLGFQYIKKMLLMTLGSKPNMALQSMGLSKDEQRKIQLDIQQIPADTRLQLAYGALKNMGLTEGFAPLVFFMGHASESANNPYAAALDCGACAGHSGHGNAQFLAALLNDQSVRQALIGKGIRIPETTTFVSGWHNTTTDELILDADVSLSKENQQILLELKESFQTATQNTRQERGQTLPYCKNEKNLKEEVQLKANHWSEIRPEWGLARNAAFVVGRRQWTRGLNMEGRTFLHDYDKDKDQDLSVLELIMTAPMIVTHWINMQYYASTISPTQFGAGNKVLNNVVAGIGCVQGNGGDLLTGLTEQSVWYRGEYYHEPIRLQVFIEAPEQNIEKMILKHQMISDLVSHHWLNIIAWNGDERTFKRYTPQGWVEEKQTRWS